MTTWADGFIRLTHPCCREAGPPSKRGGLLFFRRGDGSRRLREVERPLDLLKRFLGRTSISLRHPDRGVAQSLCDDLEAHPLRRERAAEGVAQVMKTKAARDTGKLLREREIAPDRC